MRIAIYARFSKDDTDSESTQDQVLRLRRHAEAQGDELVGEYVDDGYSAWQDKAQSRPRFQAMVSDAKEGKFDIVLVKWFSRFARDRYYSRMYKRYFKELGIRVISLMQPLDEETPAGMISEGMFELIDEYNSLEHSIKMLHTAERRVKEKGLWNGPLSFGYRRGKDNRAIVQAGEAGAVKQAFEMYASGRYTYAQVASWLNSTQFRPREHRRDRRNRGYTWGLYTVRGILRNPFYLGQVTYKGELFPGQHEAIIPQELFDRVQRVRKEHFTGPWTYTPRHRTYLLGGLVRCAACGTKLWAQHQSGNDYYREDARRRGLPQCPGKKIVRGDVVEEQVERIVTSLKLPASWREMVVQQLSSTDDRQRVGTERKRLSERKRRLWRTYLDGMPEDEYRRELGAVDAALKSLEDPQQEEVVHIGDHIEGMLEAWHLATKEEKRDLLKMMVDAVYVDVQEAKVVAIQVKPAFKPLFQVWLDNEDAEKRLLGSGQDFVHVGLGES